MIRFYPHKIIFLAGFVLFLMGFSNVTLSQIETAIIQQQYTDALSLADRFIKEDPPADEYHKALYYIGLSHLSLGQYDDAKAVFRKLSSQQPQSSLYDKAQIGIIDSHILSGEYQKALNLAADLLRQRPHSEFKGLIYLKMARSNMKLTRWEEAQGLLQKIVAEFPLSLESHLARQLLDEKQHFAVQVGSFLDKGKARTLLEELKNQGDYAYMIETIDKTGEKFYRVRVGRFSQLDEAMNLKERLSRQGYPTLIYP